MRGLTTCFVRTEGVKRRDIQRRLLHSAESNHLQPTLCSAVYGRQVWQGHCTVSVISTPRNYDTVKQNARCEGDGGDV